MPFDTCAVWDRQTIFIVGEEPVELLRSFSWRTEGDGWSYVGNRMLVCPRCKRIWAYLDFGKAMGWEEAENCLWPVPAFCSRCPAPGPVPSGSLLVAEDADGRNFDLPLLFALPERLLRREVDLHFTQLKLNKEENHV